MIGARRGGVRGRRPGWWLVIAAGAVGVWLLAMTGSRSSVPTFSTQEALATAGIGPVEEERLPAVEVLHLAPGQAPALALDEAGLSGTEVSGVLRALGAFADVRAMQPRDEFRLYRTRDGRTVRVEYQRHPQRFYVAAAGDDGFSSHQVDLPVEHLLRHFEGEVTGNLHDSMLRTGGGAGLVVEMSDLFAWSFDFFTDTRNGDRFEVLVEEERVDGRRIGFGRVLAARYHPVGDDVPLEVFRHEIEGKNGAELAGYYHADGKSIRRMFLKSPLNYRRISSHFSHRRMHPIFKKVRPHLGIDYAANHGTPVSALGRGKVVFAGWINGFGKTVKIKHNGNYLTQYAHLSGYGKGIRAGARVDQGQTIGFVGSTGNSTGPHLDFRVQENGRWINPLRLKGGRAEPLPRGEMAEFRACAERLALLLDELEPGAALAWDGAEGAVGAETLAGVQLDTNQGS